MSRVAVDTSSISPEQLQTCYQLKRNVAHIVEVRLIAIERFPCDHPGPLKMLPSLQQHAHLKVFVASQGFHHNGSIEHTYVRYMRARKWDLHKATDMLTKTLNWRLDYKPYATRWADIEVETNGGGKHFLFPVTDKSGRPIVMMRPRMEDTKTYDSQIRFLIYDLEMASRIADRSGVGKMTWVLDFTGYGLKNAVPLRVSMQGNTILMNHYPERLGCAVCYHAPALFSITWKAVSPFIDPVTKQKIQFIDKGKKEAEQMNSLFFMDKMESEIGGGYPGLLYKKAEYEKICRAFDAEVENELRAMEAVMRPSPEKSLLSSSVNDSSVNDSTHAEKALSAENTLSVEKALSAVHIKERRSKVDDEGFVSCSEDE